MAGEHDPGALTARTAAAPDVRVAVEAVRWYIDGGCRTTSLADLALERGLEVADLLRVMRLMFDPLLEERPAPMVVPERWRNAGDAHP